MKRIEEQLAGLPVIRCHRSYIVNTERIKLARKGGNGLILQINAPGKIELPVSEKYRTSILNSLKG
jgi:DNA-binding LytR/AlgR family response regulator